MKQRGIMTVAHGTYYSLLTSTKTNMKSRQIRSFYRRYIRGFWEDLTCEV